MKSFMIAKLPLNLLEDSMYLLKPFMPKKKQVYRFQD